MAIFSTVRLAGVALAAAALVALATWHITSERAERLGQIAQAVAAEQTKWVLEREVERARQAQVNQEIQREAEDALRALDAKNDALERQLKDMADEASRDPDRDRCGLGAGGVLRLDRIR